MEENLTIKKSNIDAAVTAHEHEILEQQTPTTYEYVLDLFEKDDDSFIEFEGFEKFSSTIRLKKHDHLTLAGETGSGKSALALNWVNSLSKKYPIIYFNLEMDELTVYKRLIAINEGIEIQTLDNFKKDSKIKNIVSNGLKEITSRKPIFVFNTTYNISQMHQLIEKHSKKEHTIVFIDHALLMDSSNGSKGYEKFTDIAKDLRKISRNENITLIVLTQMNRESKKTCYKPSVSALKESGEFESSSSHVAFIYQRYDKDGKMIDGSDELLVRKNRNGANGLDIPLSYDRSTQKIQESTNSIKEYY